MAKIAGDTYRTQKAAYKGVAKIDDVVDAAKKSPGNLQEVLKGKNLSSEDINKITKKITAEYKSTPKYAEKLNKLITSKGAPPSTIEPSKIRSVVNKLSGETNTKIFTTAKKGQPKEFTKELKDILTAEKLTPAQIRELAKNLKGKNAPKTFDEIADWLVNSQKSSPTVGGFGAIDPTQALIGGAAALGAGKQLATWRTPSREEQMAEEYDIYN
jgi:F0F1-type ATP synthase delta subunit